MDWNLISLVFVAFGSYNLQPCMSVPDIDTMDSTMCWNSSSEIISMCYLSKEECVNQNGIPVDGNCLLFYNQCCIFDRNYECEVETDGDDLFISSPGYPRPVNEWGICKVSIKKHPFEDRQLRIDFIDFNMTSPSDDKTGICDTDKMTITDFTVCGQLHNQYFYHRLDANTYTVDMQFTTIGSHYNRAWRIKLSKEFYTEEKPYWCNQYFPRASGTIYMFNPSLNGQLMENRQDFRICIKRDNNVCSIVFKPCEPHDEPFIVKKSLLFSDVMSLIRLGPEIHSAIPKNIRGGCVRYEQKYCSDFS